MPKPVRLPDQEGVPALFCDVDDDRFAIPLDALLVINRLNEPTQSISRSSVAVPEPTGVFIGVVGMLLIATRRSAQRSWACIGQVHRERRTRLTICS